MEEIKKALKIFHILLEEGELNRENNFELFNSYSQEKITKILEVIEEEFSLKFIEHTKYIYLVSKISEGSFGLNLEEFKNYFWSNFGNKEIYLCYYIFMYILYEFYNGKNSNPKIKEFMMVGELIDRLDIRFESLMQMTDDEINEKEEKWSINLKSSLEVWKGLMVSSETKKKTKENLIEILFKVLEKQGLAFIIERHIRTSKKLDDLMSEYYLNFDRVKEINKAFEMEEL